MKSSKITEHRFGVLEPFSHSSCKVIHAPWVGLVSQKITGGTSPIQQLIRRGAEQSCGGSMVTQSPFGITAPTQLRSPPSKVENKNPGK